MCDENAYICRSPGDHGPWAVHRVLHSFCSQKLSFPGELLHRTQDLHTVPKWVSAEFSSVWSLHLLHIHHFWCWYLIAIINIVMTFYAIGMPNVICTQFSMQLSWFLLSLNKLRGYMHYLKKTKHLLSHHLDHLYLSTYVSVCRFSLGLAIGL